MRSPIDILISRIEMRCTICQAKMGTCGCWVKMECPSCGASKTAQRHKTDPEGTALVLARCPDCDDDGSEYPEILYCDAAGRQLPVF